MKNNDWKNEFTEFLNTESIPVPRSISDKIFLQITAELNPPLWKIFAKTSMIHLIAGSLTLTLCPQFGFSFTQFNGLMSYLMKFGHTVCMLGCGAVFLGLSFLTASLILKPDEARALKKEKFTHLILISFVSLALFFCVDSQIVVSTAAIWFVGAITGGVGSLEVGWRVRQWIMKRALI